MKLKNLFFIFVLFFSFFSQASLGHSGVVCWSPVDTRSCSGDASSQFSRYGERAVSMATIACTTQSPGLWEWFKDEVRSFFGIKRKPKTYRSPAGHECSCKDPDFCWARRLKNRDLEKEYKRYATGKIDALVAPVREHSGWWRCGFDRLSREAQLVLAKKFGCLERRFIHQEAMRKEEEQKRFIEQKKKPHRPVQNQFIEQAHEVALYQKEQMFFFREQRITAIQEALENNFKISIQQYHMTSQAKQLLKQHNIDVDIFKSCVGNAIQQQAHAEFVAVLNDGAALYTEKDGLPGVTSLLDATWLQTLGSISSAGVRINLLGRYQLTFTLADMCHGIYEIGKNAAHYRCDTEQQIFLSSESIWSSCVECAKRVSKNTGDAVVDFTDGVSQKAFARQAQVITKFVDLLQHHPDVVYEKASELLLNSVHCVFDAIKLHEVTMNNSGPKKTTQMLDDFQQNWAGPIREKIVAAADVFWQMPRKEKAQELVALGLQVAAVVVAVKTIAAAPAGIAMLNTGAVLQAEKLAHLVQAMLPGGGQTGVNPDGTVSFVAEAAEPLTETLAAVAGKVSSVGVGVNAGLTVVADAVGSFVLAVRDGVAQGVSQAFSGGTETTSGGEGPNVPPTEPDEELARRIEENKQLLEEMKGREIYIHPKYEKLALEGNRIFDGGRCVDAGSEYIGITDQEAKELRDLFWETIGGEESLKILGLEGAELTEYYIKHVTSPEIKTMITRAGRESKLLAGCHVLPPELLENGTIDYEIIQDGLVKEVRIFCEGVSKEKTVFPIGWMRKDAVIAFGKSIKKAAEAGEKLDLVNGTYSIEATLDSGIKIVTKVSRDKVFKTSYPEI